MGTRYAGYNLLKMIKENKIRNGDILVVYRKDDPSFVDYYTVGERDIYWLLDPENSTYLFDNFLLLQFVRDYEFSVVFNKELKENIIKKIREED